MDHLVMVRYRRDRTPGGTWFFTVTLKDRSSDLLVRRIDLLLECWDATAQVHPFRTIAASVLPDHLHCIWQLPPDDGDYPKRWQSLKKRFTLGLGGARSPWQSRYWEHAIRDTRDLEAHVNYIHYNPVKHGYVSRACDWPHGTFRRFVRQGRLPVDWGLDERVVGHGRFGE